MRIPTSVLVLLLLLFSVGCEARPAQDVADAPVTTRTASSDAAAADTADVRGDALPTASASWTAPVPTPSNETQRLFDATMKRARAQELQARPLGRRMQALGLHFSRTPYAAGVLDAPSEEQLVCTLNGFDCVTFVETTLAMGRALGDADYSYDTFARTVRDQRYRGGHLDGYCSRLHYFSEWILDNEARGTVRNITRELGGVPLDKRIDFMGTHRDSYPRLVDNDSLFQCIRAMESRLADADLYYIPQNAIAGVYDRLQAGDIIAIATSIKGLDVSHTGLVHKGDDGSTGLLHASTSGGVMVSPDLQAYIQKHQKQIGIVVARPQGAR